MLKKREVLDCALLYELITHPDVFPFVRQKPSSLEEYIFMTKQMMEAEERGELISRTIVDEWGNPIGVITLYDINEHAGFLGTWIGKPYHGKGYNTIAKEQFFHELFYENEIETIFMRIRHENIRSQKAAEKLPYAIHANDTRASLLKQINNNQNGFRYFLYEIPKDLYTLYCKKQQQSFHPIHILEA